MGNDMNEGDELDLAAATAGATPNNRDAIERRRRVASFLCDSDRELAIPRGDRLVDSLRDDASFDGWVDKVLRAALASKGKLAPRRYRTLWMIKNATRVT
jgi:hypothetical protein